MLGRLAVPKIIYGRPVGSPANTSNIGENPNINDLGRDPLDPHPNRPAGLLSKIYLWHIFGPDVICPGQTLTLRLREVLSNPLWQV